MYPMPPPFASSRAKRFRSIWRSQTPNDVSWPHRVIARRRFGPVRPLLLRGLLRPRQVNPEGRPRPRLTLDLDVAAGLRLGAVMSISVGGAEPAPFAPVARMSTMAMAAPAPPPSLNNREVATAIADVLRQAGKAGQLRHYNIDVTVKDGTAELTGTVALLASLFGGPTHRGSIVPPPRWSRFPRCATVDR